MWIRNLGALLGLAAMRAHAAPPVLDPEPRFAPKGHPSLEVSPAPHAATYLYVTYFAQAGALSAGAGASMVQGDPALAAGDAHTLAEIGVSSADGTQIVEIGWTVDELVNHDVQPRLFVFHWVDGQPTCYNGCGWVQVSSTRAPGMRVVPGAREDYAIKLEAGDWWLYYQGEGIGYFPGSLWGGRFTAAGHVQWFGEIAAASAEPCSEMGNGARGADPAASSMEALFLVEPGGAEVAAVASASTITNPALYSIGRTTPTSFAFGGPGSPFGCCRPSTCADASAACGRVPDACGPSLPCGSCPDLGVCSASFACLPEPPPGDGIAPDDASAAGCCGAGGGASSVVPGLILVAGLGRGRRRRRPTAHLRRAIK